MRKICLFGDSLSKGVIYDQILGRYTFLKDSFASLVSKDGRLGILNFAKFGCTIGKAKSIIMKHMGDAANSNVTALEFGGNDSDYDWTAISEDPLAEHKPKTTLDDFAASYTEVVEDLKSNGVRVVMLNLLPIDEHKYFEWFSSSLNKENILAWLGGDVEYIYRWHEMYNMQVCSIANSCNVPLIDIRSSFLKKRDYSNYLCVDGIHPNAAGHELISSTIQEYIPILEKKYV